MGKRIRIGKDIAIRWHITLPEGNNELLSDMDLSIAMKDPKGLPIAIKDYDVVDNDLLIGLKGTTFAWLGNYTLTLWKNKGKDGQTVVDAVNAFTLVNSTDKETDENSTGSGVLEIKTVDLYSELTFLVNSAGADAGLTEKVALLEMNVARLASQMSGLQTAISQLERRVTELENGGQGGDPDVIEITGVFSYSNASVSASGGTATPTNTMQLVKNGTVQQVSFTFSSDKSYASVDSANGVVTFQSSQSSAARTATITASCVFEGRTYSRTATVTQAAYVPPVVEEYVYAGSAKNTTSYPVSISGFTAGASSTTKTVNYTPTELVNTIIAVCPSTMSLTSCVKHGEIEDDITDYMLASASNVTYENKSCKMYQFKYSSSIRNNAFTITFN